MKYCTSIGIDTHSRKNAICALSADTGVVAEDVLSEDPAQVISWIRQHSFAEPICCVYEAGPTGFELARALNGAGIRCVVAATSKLPYRTDRVKNDRVDAQWLARMLAAGSVREVYVPTEREESLRNLSKLRAETASDLRRAKQRVASFLLKTHTRYTLTKRRWTKAFYRWAASFEFDEPCDTFAFRQKLEAVLYLEEKLSEIDDEIRKEAKASKELARTIARLSAIHGIGLTTAFSLAAEVYDFKRFKNGSAFSAYIGLVPSERSSGKKTSRGPVTKCGNSNLRRLLIEAVHAYDRPYRGTCDAKRENARAVKCRKRLYKRKKTLEERGLEKNKVYAALARELCEWIYWIATENAA